MQIGRGADGWEATFDYWAIDRPDRPIDTLRVILEADGRLRTVEILAAGINAPGGG
jgi:hypothetical protein